MPRTTKAILRQQQADTVATLSVAHLDWDGYQ